MPSAASGNVLSGLITEAELCAELGVTARTVGNYRKAGMPIAVQRGKIKRFDPVAVRRWLMGEKRRRPGRPQKRGR